MPTDTKPHRRLPLGLAAISMGAALGFIGARVLFVGSWLSLIPWGVAGVGIGASAADVSTASLTGAVYGFALTMAFMIAGYTGSASLLSRLPFFGLLAVVGALCGLTSSIVGALIMRPVRRRRVGNRRHSPM